MPLTMQGTIASVETRTPTQEELDTCRHVVLSSEHPWDPHSMKFPAPSQSVEEEMVARNISAIKQVHFDQGVDDNDESVVYSIDDISRRMISGVQVLDVKGPKTFQSRDQHTSVTPEDMSERWSIGTGQAKETIK